MLWPRSCAPLLPTLPMLLLKSPPLSLTSPRSLTPLPLKTPPILSRSSAAGAALFEWLSAGFGAPLLVAGPVKQQQPEPELPPKPLQLHDPLQPPELELPLKPEPPPEPELPPRLPPVQLLGVGPKLPLEPKLLPGPGKGSGKPGAWPKSLPTEPESLETSVPAIKLPPELEP